MTNTQRFTRRELEVIQLLLKGFSNKQISAALHISERTVEFHLFNIYTKLGVNGRVEAVLALNSPAGRALTGDLGDSTANSGGGADSADSGDSGGEEEDFLRESTVAGNGPAGHNGGSPSSRRSNPPPGVRMNIRQMGEFLRRYGVFLFLGAVVVALLILTSIFPPGGGPVPTATGEPLQTSVHGANLRTISILVDDFRPQPYQGEKVYYFNRLDGDRGAVNNSDLQWGDGQVITTISPGSTWGGVWMSLNHPTREGLGVNFSAVLPAQIAGPYQSKITGIAVRIAGGTPRGKFRVELKNGGEICWKKEIELTGREQTLQANLPRLGSVDQLVWVLDNGAPGDFVTLKQISFTATTAISDPAMQAFVWSYGMLLNNWNPETGLVRDKAKDASGEFDAIQVTGSLAAATAEAEQLGVIDQDSAAQIVQKIGDTLLGKRMPRYKGLWPHWVKAANGGQFVIVDNTEWSSVDTSIAALGLLDAQSALGLDTSATEKMLQEIDWPALLMPTGISHGYDFAYVRFPYAWDTFGGESWVVELAYAAATGKVAPLDFPDPPTANGSGFIDELAWLYVPPPAHPDAWGTDWKAYREQAADEQLAYYPDHYPSACFTRLGIFGLSAGEQPVPARVPPQNIYQPFGLGGHFNQDANDGALAMGAPVAAPHYSAMIASLRPNEALNMWQWLIQSGKFTPLNNVETLTFPADSSCDPSAVEWNQLKGSWNLALQTLGWGRYLAERDGKTPAAWQAVAANPFLQKGYRLLAPGETLAASITSPGTTGSGATASGTMTPGAATPGVTPVTATPAAAATQNPTILQRECESPDEATVGQTLQRSNASGTKVHGQFGTAGEAPWPAKAGYVLYNNISVPTSGTLYLKLRYSKNSPPTASIRVYLDGETTPRATLTLADQGNWDSFVWTAATPLGSVQKGVHALKFATDGEPYGTADLDQFMLTYAGPAFRPTATPAAQPTGIPAGITQGPALPEPRANHTATLLEDGKVLLIGGTRAEDTFLSSVLIFDPATGTYHQAAPMHTARHGHSATLMQDGRVLVVGGYTLPQQWVNDAEVYDPFGDTWTVISPHYSHGTGHTATLLDDGRVLVTGGCYGSWQCTDRVELFDPETDTWADGPRFSTDHSGQIAQLLEDGSVLVAGGWSARGCPAGSDALLFDPATDSWSAAGQPVVQLRANASSVRLEDGRVLVAGGISTNPCNEENPAPLNSAEIYDPATNSWSAAGSLAQPRYLNALALLPNGKVLAVGGMRDNWNVRSDGSSFVAEIESYDPQANLWQTVGVLPRGMAWPAAALLEDGRLWVSGGRIGAEFFNETWMIAGR